MTAILEFRGATKTFRGIPAIKDIDFTLRRGEIHAIAASSSAFGRNGPSIMGTEPVSSSKPRNVA